MIRRSKKKGLTAIELILAVMIFATTIGVILSMIKFSVNSSAIHTLEFNLQSNIRLAVETVSDRVQSSAAVFTIPTGSFRTDNLSNDWDYFGLTDDRKQIVEYAYRQSGTIWSHQTRVLASAEPNTHYNITFSRELNEATEVIAFTIEIKDDDNGEVLKSLTKKVSAVNALQIVDRGTASQPAVGLAYRGTERDFSNTYKPVFGNVTLVVDVSGSMNDSLDGYSYPLEEDRRITSVENALVGYYKGGKYVEGLISRFAKFGDIKLSFVPFSTTANYPNTTKAYTSTNRPYYSLSSGATGADYANATAEAEALSGKVKGGTNTGDAIRQGYYHLKDVTSTIISENPSGVLVKEFMVILFDGRSTFSSTLYNPSAKGSFMLDKGPQSNVTTYWHDVDWYGTDHGIYGDGRTLEQVHKDYIAAVSNIAKNKGVEFYLIGFSRNEGDVKQIEDIAEGLNIPTKRVYNFATDSIDLDATFESIFDQITAELWLVKGPAY